MDADSGVRVSICLGSGSKSRGAKSVYGWEYFVESRKR